MAGNFWTRDTGPSGTTTTYEVAMTESLSYTIVNDRYLTRIFVDDSIASGQTLTLSLASGGTWLQTVSVFNQSSTESITVTNGSESFSLAPGNEEAFYIYSGTLYNTSSQYVKLASDNTFSGDNTFTGSNTFSGDATFSGGTTFSSAPLAEAGIQLTSGRKFAEELDVCADGAFTVSTEGWYKIANIDLSSSDRVRTGEIQIVLIGPDTIGGTGCSFGITSTGGSKKDYINLIPQTGIDSSSTETALAYRMGRGSSYGDGGIIEAYLLADTYSAFNMQARDILGHIGGIELVTPVASDGLLPDGETSATYLEAGTEFVLHNYRTNVNILGHMSTTAGAVDVTVNWKQIPKQDATDLNITIPSSLILRDISGNTCTLTTSPTISSVDTVVDGEVAFRMTDATNITGLTAGSPIFFYPSGGAVTLTLS